MMFVSDQKKHQFHKASTTIDNTELSQCDNIAIANPHYVTIKDTVDEDVYTKIQDGDGIKTEMTKISVKPTPVTKKTVTVAS